MRSWAPQVWVWLPRPLAGQVLQYYAQWEKSGHAKQAGANYILDDRARKNPSDRTCLACHTGQGYIEYVSKKFMSSYRPG